MGNEKFSPSFYKSSVADNEWAIENYERSKLFFCFNMKRGSYCPLDI